MTKKIYNLEFPNYINEIKIGHYIFKRVKEYDENFLKLHHLIDSSGSEFHITPTTGGHQITAIVEYENNEPSAVLPWGQPNSKQLDDILLLFGIFTNRNVFWSETNDSIILADSRHHHYGGILPSSLPFENEFFDINKNVSVKEKDINYYLNPFIKRRNKGFESGMNKIVDLISSQKWLTKYNNGYFLFLYRLAIQRMTIETNFILCWSVWNHLYSILNKGKLTDDEIRKVSESAKIEFMLKEYFYTKLVEKNSKVELLSRCRHRIIHFGIKSDEITFEEMDLFIRTTECLIAKLLELSPSNSFNTLEKLPIFLGIR